MLIVTNLLIAKAKGLDRRDGYVLVADKEIVAEITLVYPMKCERSITAGLSYHSDLKSECSSVGRAVDF